MRTCYYVSKSEHQVCKSVKKRKVSASEVLKMYRLRAYPYCHQKNEKRITRGIAFSLCDSISFFAILVYHLNLSLAIYTWKKMICVTGVQF